jgi:hypothetical protein
MELKFFAGLLSVALALSGDAGAQQASTSPHMILVRKNTVLKFRWSSSIRCRQK